MAINKHAFLRYKTLDKCFRNKRRKYFIEDLIEECNLDLEEHLGAISGVKKRQIFKDISYMESEAGYSIELERHKDGKKFYYRYYDVNFSIQNQPINVKEEQLLKDALITLSRLKGMPQFEWGDELVIQLDSGLNLSHHTNKVIEFEQNEYLVGRNFIADLYESIISKTVQNIEYKSFKVDNSINILFHPYYLKQYNNRWFVFGRNDEYNTIQNLSLDRIIGLDISNVDYKENDLVDFSEYFEDVIGVTVEKNPIVKVKLKVHNSLLPYIKTKPLHGSQKVYEFDDTYGIVSIEVIPNYELESLLLSFGEKLVVLEPSEMLDKLVDRIHLMSNKYNDRN